MERTDTDFLDSVVRESWVPSLCRGMLELPGFKAALSTPLGLRLPGNRCCLPFVGATLPGLLWLGFVGGRELHTDGCCTPSQPACHVSITPAPPSASGRPELGAVGGHFLHGGLQLSLKMTLVSLEVQWQKTKLQMNAGNIRRFLELFCVCRYMWYFKSESTDVLLNLDLKPCLDPALDKHCLTWSVLKSFANIYN